jgi:AraC-like DNA-binding protein
MSKPTNTETIIRREWRRVAGNGHLMRFPFTTDGLSHEERLWAYQFALGSHMATKPLTPDLRARLDSYVVGSLFLTVADCSARSSDRTLEHIAQDKRNEFGVQLTLEGESEGEADGRPVATRAGDLAIFDAGRPYKMTDLTDRRGITVIVSRSVMVALGCDIDSLHGLVIGPQENALLTDHLRSLIPLLPTLPLSASNKLARVIQDLLAVVIPRAEAEPTSAASRKARRHEELAERAFEWVEQHLTDEDLTPETVAKALRVSRSRLYEIFAPSGGIASHILARRTAAVRESLQDPEETRGIAELSHHWGFQSETHFSRVFRASYGSTASEFRRSLGLQHA